MSFMKWLKEAFASPPPRYNPEHDPLVQALRKQTVKARRQSAVLRHARSQGRPASFEEMFGIEVPPRARERDQ